MKVHVRGTFVAAIVAAAILAVGCSPSDDRLVRAGNDAPLRYEPTAIGAAVDEFGEPWVSHVEIVDVDQDGMLDVLYCDGKKNSVRWIRQSPRGTFTETVIAADVPGPAHVSTADLNATGRLDVLVACMGIISPNNEEIGSVLVLENLDNRAFRKRVLIEHVARVTDVQAANLAGHTNGRLDLIVGQFGYVEGEISWMRNLGNWQFERTLLHDKPGTIHTPVADFDGDGLMDFAALIAQHDEEVRLFRNLGNGRFASTVSWHSANADWGSSGMAVVDLNRDSKPDLLFTNGDGLDYPGSDLRPWHGLQWLENTGAGFFRYHHIGNLPGVYAPCSADLDGDGDWDIVTVSAFAEWSKPESVSLMAWLNNGSSEFSPVPLAHRPIGLISAAVGDLDGNGVPVIVTGGFYPWPPFEHMSNITLWRRK